MKKTLIAAVGLLTVITALFAMAAKQPTPAAPAKKPVATAVSAGGSDGVIGVSLRNEVNAAIARSLEWLVAQQKEDGSWSNRDFPALTGLPLKAFAQDPRAKKNPAAAKAVKYILSCVQKDGGIYKSVPDRKGGGLGNYNTAICMSALNALGDKSLLRTILDARTFVASSQYQGADVYKGGFGYDKDTKRAYTDLLNTYYSVEAMVETAKVEDLRPKSEKRADIDWNETVKYIAKMQNKPKSGKEDAWGFFYKPGESKAGSTTNEAGVVVFRSYGSMTYVGMLALIHANVSRDDVRVQSAFDWSSRHWSLKENPGMGAQGLYFFYNVLTKSLSAYGQDMVPLPDGSLVNWRIEVAKMLVSKQKIDAKTGHGYWVNDSGRFWESDPVLVTAYAILALQLL